MVQEEQANPKLKRILSCVVRELEKICNNAWHQSKNDKDMTGAIETCIPDWSDESLIKEIERRTIQIEERKRYIAGLHGGAEGHQRSCEFRADELYNKYCQ